MHFANAQGLEIDASFTRETSIYGPEYSTVRFKITNRADYPILNVQVSNVVRTPRSPQCDRLSTYSCSPSPLRQQYGESGQDLKCILDLAELRGSSTTSVLASANFACSNAPIKFDVRWGRLGIFVSASTPADRMLLQLPAWYLQRTDYVALWGNGSTGCSIRFRLRPSER